MSSETSTEVEAKPDPANSLQPWQFFVLAALGCATAATFLIRSHGVIPVVLLSVLMGTTALVGLAALRAVRPLFSHDDRSTVIGGRTRAALEQEKTLALRTIKELEFDRAMGKVSEDDFHEMATRLRARATRLIKQLDSAQGYRAQIEHDVARRMGEASAKAGEAAASVRTCGKCSTANDQDARFCKSCGERLS